MRRLTGLNGYVQSLAFAADGRSFAAGGWRGIKVWETQTGAERCQFTGLQGDAFALAFAPDGRRLVSGCGDTTALVWDLTGGLPSATLPPLDELWEQLAKASAADAYRGMWELVGRSAQAVPFLGKQLKPATGPPEEQIAKLVKDLDSDDFDTRQRASSELTDLGDLAESSMRKALTAALSLEQRRRIDMLLAKLAESALAPPRLQVLRTVETLELIGTPKARTLLRSLARGAAGARLTREAQQSFDRLLKLDQQALTPEPEESLVTKRRTDLLGDTLPVGAVTRIGTTRLFQDGHAFDSHLAFTSGGKNLLFCTRGGNLRICNAATGQELHRIEHGSDDRIVFASRRTARRWRRPASTAP